jgi:hypothetical protein
MADLRDLWRELTLELQPLRMVFPASEKGTNALRVFDEFVSENELELALHVACDFLLEPDSLPTSSEVQSRLRSLHSAMGIEDDCVLRLQQKALLD